MVLLFCFTPCFCKNLFIKNTQYHLTIYGWMGDFYCLAIYSFVSNLKYFVD